MNKIYYLSSCSTCVRIINELGINESNFEMQDIKKQNINEQQLDAIAKKVGSYEKLFSKRAMKYKALGLKDKNLQEKDFRKYMLEEYTFLSRPFIIIDGEPFIGNSKKVVEAARTKLLG